ncbi:MAG: AarF/ABC1/UbiB kinase family protein [Candidatus Cloacimonetes bacterium]|nr:AarF/ABC1/UbiB kinase family protein [Candidatus Cloacimonadota bacterium]
MIPKIGLISRTYRHINRYREIITVLVKHGFGDLVTNTNLEKYIDFGKKLLSGKRIPKIAYYSRWERIRMALEELGPTFIKFGQIMSNRPDLLPQELIIELEKLQDSVPPFAEKAARQLIEEELGKPISTTFKRFISTPIASASIAQVHKAILMNGEKVVIKVQRPRIEQIIEVDLEIMLHLATLMEKHIKGMDILNPVGIVKEFERSIRKEIDFKIEATHIERFGRNFQDDMNIYVPKVYRNYTTKKILTMEFIDGIKVSNIEAVLKSGNDPKIIASRGADLVLKQIFEHGFFHADPHPGNILVLNNNIICFLDFGMMGVLLPKHREYLGSIIIGIVNKDAKRITKTLVLFSTNSRIENIERLEYQVSELIEQYSYLPLKDINVGELLNKGIKLILVHKIEIPPDLYLLSKALITIESVGRNLDPDFDMVKHTEPFAKKLLKERLSPRKLAKDLYLSATEFTLLLRDFPSEIREIIKQIKLGQFKIEFEHKGLEPMLKKHDQISNRIAFAIVLASLIIGSSLIVLSGIPPKWNGIPIIGIVGFLGAGLMGFWLLVSILRHGKM